MCSIVDLTLWDKGLEGDKDGDSDAVIACTHELVNILYFSQYVYSFSRDLAILLIVV